MEENYSVLLRKWYTAWIGPHVLQRLQWTAPRFVGEQSTEWYRDWRESRFKRHMHEYYSMIFKKIIYINGSVWNQHELVLPEVTWMEFGPDHTTHPQMIRRKLEAIKTIEFWRHFTFFQSFIMLLVNAIESQLYPLELWPTYILTCMFAFDPRMPFSLTQIEKVIAFFRQWGPSFNGLSILCGV